VTLATEPLVDLVEAVVLIPRRVLFRDVPRYFGMDKNRFNRECSEYNRSIPGALKNAIDWASRSAGENSFARKLLAIFGTLPGALATAIAQQHLRTRSPTMAWSQMNQPPGFCETT
jgi:hypothetical protein